MACAYKTEGNGLHIFQFPRSSRIGFKVKVSHSNQGCQEGGLNKLKALSLILRVVLFG
jgi:hypothetical protein